MSFPVLLDLILASACFAYGIYTGDQLYFVFAGVLVFAAVIRWGKGR